MTISNDEGRRAGGRQSAWRSAAEPQPNLSCKSEFDVGAFLPAQPALEFLHFLLSTTPAANASPLLI